MEHFNPVIIVALIIQGIISRVSHLAGAITGYLITTGILIWGIGLYSDGNAVALFGIPLSKQVFIVACIVLYAFDKKELSNVRKHEEPEARKPEESSLKN